MKDFFAAIYTLGTSANDFNAAVGGRFYYGMAPQDCALPYAVFFGVSETPGDTFTEEIDEIAIQVNIYSDKQSASESMDIYKKCRSLFDSAAVQVGGLDVLLEREMSTPPWKDDDRWTISVEFTATIQNEG